MQIRYADAATRQRILDLIDPRFANAAMVLDTSLKPGVCEVIQGTTRQEISFNETNSVKAQGLRKPNIVVDFPGLKR